MSQPIRKKISPFVLAVLVSLMLLSTYLVYRPGLTGPFLFDDDPNIVKNTGIAIQDLHTDTLWRAAFSVESGVLRRPLSMLSFAVNYYFTGYNQFYFKISNLFIHLANGIGIATLSYLLLDAYRKRFQPNISDRRIQTIALYVAAAWMLHPFNLTSVLYIVQRMTSLSALFVIWGLALFVWGRIRCLEGQSGVIPILISLIIFMPLAILSKESGALMPAFMLAIEISLFRLQAVQPASRRFLLAFYSAVVGLPALIVLVFLATHPLWLVESYTGRDFTLAERVMTEARVLWFYLHQIVLPSIADMGLFHDDIINSRGLLTPWTTMLSILGIAALFIVSWIARNKAPLITFGILFFFAGHALESTVLPLEITHEHRNYLPILGILLPLFFYLLYPLNSVAKQRLSSIGALLLISLFAFDTWTRSTAWASPIDFFQSEVQHHPNSPRDNGELGNNYASVTTEDPVASENWYQAARYYYERTIVVDPDYTNGLFGLLLETSKRGKDIDPHWIDELEHRLRYSSLENDTGNKLLQLLNCQMKQVCKLSHHDLERLIKAPLSNPTVVGAKRALVLGSLSYYLVDIATDYPAALDVMYQTVETAPHELEHRLNLIKFLLAMQRNAEAKKQLEILKRMDSLNAYSIQIAIQEKQLVTQEMQH